MHVIDTSRDTIERIFAEALRKLHLGVFDHLQNSRNFTTRHVLEEHPYLILKVVDLFTAENVGAVDVLHETTFVDC